MVLEIPRRLQDRLQRVAKKLHLDESGVEHWLVTVVDAAIEEAGQSPQSEEELLKDINAGFPPDWWQRYRALVAAREASEITPGELDALISMTEAVEERHAARMEAAAALAALRGVELRHLIAQMGLSPEFVTTS